MGRHGLGKTQYTKAPNHCLVSHVGEIKNKREAGQNGFGDRPNMLDL